MKEEEKNNLDAMLCVACKKDDLELIESLVSRDAVVSQDIFDNHCFMGDHETIKLLLEGNVEYYDTSRALSELLDSRRDHLDEFVIEVLVKNDAYVKRSDFIQFFEYSYSDGDLDIVELLIENNEEASQIAFEFGCRKGNTQLVKLALKAGVEDSQEALHTAIRQALCSWNCSEKIQVVQDLVDLGLETSESFMCDVLYPSEHHELIGIVQQDEEYSVREEFRTDLYDRNLESADVKIAESFFENSCQDELIQILEEILEEVFENAEDNKISYDQYMNFFQKIVEEATREHLEILECSYELFFKKKKNKTEEEIKAEEKINSIIQKVYHAKQASSV